MATGAVTAPEPRVDTKTETTETFTAQPVTLKQHIQRLLCEISERHEDYIERARGM